MKAIGHGNRNENTHIFYSYDDAFTATSKEQFSVCDTGFVTVGEHITPSVFQYLSNLECVIAGVDTLECAMIPYYGRINELSIVDDSGVDGRPHVHEEDQRNYFAQRCQLSHSLCNQVCRYCGAMFWFYEKLSACYASSSIMAAAAKSGGLPKFTRNGQPGGTSLPNPEMIMPVSNRLSKVIGDCISPVQSAFIKGRYILDRPLILNDVLAEYRQYNKELLLFKVDFKKSFDSVRRDFLDAVIEKMGFGLKINVDKSNVLGVGVSPKEVAQMESIIGCEVSKLLFKYLGVPVGGNRSRCVNWNVIIRKFSTKLSSWKARLLSVGGRLSLTKAVLGNLPTRSSRGGVELAQFDALNSSIGDVLLTDQCDSWQWNLDVVAGFSVASVRSLVDDTTLHGNLVAIRWNRTIPINVNAFLWRLYLKKPPSKVNLDRKGVEVGSILCSSCLLDVETVNHIFFNCEMAKDLWSLLAKWWELDILVCANISDCFDWLEEVRINVKARSILEGVGETLMWSIWNFRNHLIFSNPPPKKVTIWDFIVSHSFL
uniref:Reverse transcriptase zinc-binding domain-containing protein n=1 Tax=Tanacetum cinerariifolium TaxID=118510 RepID=A0A699HLB0_TANCI|nr:hypothetical protein [Tanacetum cinerariifolium]